MPQTFSLSLSLFSLPSESLFQPVFKNKVTQSPMPSGLRFSTFGYLDSSTPSPPPPPNIMTLPGGHCPTHSQSKGNTMPHQHSHHHHYHHIHSSTNQSSLDGIDKGTGTMESDEKQKKFMVKKDDPQARSYNDVRKSAPDVIIIAGCNTSH